MGCLLVGAPQLVVIRAVIHKPLRRVRRECREQVKLLVIDCMINCDIAVGPLSRDSFIALE